MFKLLLRDVLIQMSNALKPNQYDLTIIKTLTQYLVEHFEL